MVKNTHKKGLKKEKEMTIPFWVLDGFVGILALTIYNFVLFILKVIGAGGVILLMEDSMGYFGLNSFVDLGFSTSQMTIGLILVFIISFLMGMGIGHCVRMKKKYKGKCI